MDKYLFDFNNKDTKMKFIDLVDFIEVCRL